MSKYRKLVAAVVGLGLLMLNRYVDIDLTGQEQAIVDIVIATLTAVGVFGFKNSDDEAEA